MRAYDDCTFDRCNVGEKNYDLMQLWLFHQHNAVTQRVWAEETNSDSFAKPPTTDPGTGTSVNQASADESTTGSRANVDDKNNNAEKDNRSVALRAELWPSTAECSTCMDASIESPYKANSTAIIEYLHLAYAI